MPGGLFWRGPSHRARAVPLPTHLGTFLSGLQRSITQRLLQTRQDQQRQDLTPHHEGAAPSTSSFPASSRKGKGREGLAESTPLPRPAPHEPHPKPSPGRGATQPAPLCATPPSPPPCSPFPPPELALGPCLPEQSRRGLLL